MSEQQEGFGNDFLVLTNEDGEEIEVEHLDTVEHNGETYYAFIPAETNLDSDGALIIMKSVRENGEEILLALDSEAEEYDELFAIFDERLADYYELDEEDE